ncbi:hypothetical protein NDU88_006441 [Pleurodeles waltl]|uniref:Reverse transcriptase domain-containing protein n=1 Tax=Pleurodeles waltl TaxID=8319 RepID=A0AAV7LQI1_PLEWA|nr:hypothetical protein NDU88_006441 [Pleurodeles waltl]
MLEASSRIQAIVLQYVNCKVFTYADDVALVTADPSTAVLEIERLANEFGIYSRYKLNQDKTQIVCSDTIRIGDHRVVEEAVYLGVQGHNSSIQDMGTGQALAASGEDWFLYSYICLPAFGFCLRVLL